MRYVVAIVLSSFSDWGATGSYDFTCPPKPRGRRTLSVVEHSVGCGGEGEKGSWQKL